MKQWPFFPTSSQGLSSSLPWSGKKRDPGNEVAFFHKDQKIYSVIENKVCIITRSISLLRLGSYKYTTAWRSVIGYTLDCLKMNWNYDCWLRHAFFIILQWKLIVLLYNQAIISICFRQIFKPVHSLSMQRLSANSLFLVSSHPWRHFSTLWAKFALRSAEPLFRTFQNIFPSLPQLVYSFARCRKPYRWEKCLGKCFDSSGTSLSRYGCKLRMDGPILLTDVKNCKTASGFGKNRGFYRRAVRFNLSSVACFVDL